MLPGLEAFSTQQIGRHKTSSDQPRKAIELKAVPEERQIALAETLVRERMPKKVER